MMENDVTGSIRHEPIRGHNYFVSSLVVQRLFA